MSGVEIALLAASAGMAALSEVSSSMQKNKQLENQAKWAEYNKGISEKNAGLSAAAGQAEADDARREGQRRLSEIRAAFGSNGLDLAGSPLDVLSDTASEGALTVARKQFAGESQATGYLNQAKSQQYEADMARSNKKSGGSIAIDALFSAGMSAATTYAGGAAKGGFGGFGGATQGSLSESAGYLVVD